jgi:hypothetical protein
MENAYVALVCAGARSRFEHRFRRGCRGEEVRSAPRVAAAETLPAAAPPVAPAPTPQDALGIALQQKLTAATKLRRDDGDAQDRAALAAFYATRVYAPLWISNGAAIVAEFSKADDWGL